MIRFGVLIFILLVSLTISLPTCKITFWVNSKDSSCSAPPNGTYLGLNYNGNCTLSPVDPNRSSYKLIINTQTKSVQNFTVYQDTTCGKDDEILMGETPLPLDSCGLLYFMTTPTSSVGIGTLIFSCQ